MRILKGNQVKDDDVFFLKSFYNDNRKKSLAETEKYFRFLRSKGFSASDIVVSERLRDKSGLFEVAVKRNKRTKDILGKAKVGEIY